jgi:SAM-dependent methyltransferase
MGKSQMKKGQVRVDRLISDLKSGRFVSDEKFDLIIPLQSRKFSTIHWTPVRVAALGAEWLRKYGTQSPNGIHRVLDVGSGCGKFCFVAALGLPEVQFTGVEQRGELVDLGNRMRDQMRIPNLNFVKADACTLDWEEYDALYFFNPFYENILPAIQMGPGVNYSAEKYRDFLELTERKLAALPSGKVVLTYNGYGGQFPDGYELNESEFLVAAHLELWVKQ